MSRSHVITTTYLTPHSDTPRTKDLIGREFGRWLVLDYAGEKRRKFFWHCRCACGVVRNVRADQLLAGSTSSCGCSHKGQNRRHGLHGTRTYRIWAAMLQRCTNPHNSSYSRYGARGIGVCKRWQSFENFLADMEQPPTNKHSLNRIDNNKGYNPSNCQWATVSTQLRNTRRNVQLTINGITKVAKDWATEYGIPANTILQRIRAGWSPEEVVELKPHRFAKNILINLNGVTLTATEWSKKTGIKAATIAARFHGGWTPAEILGEATPPQRKGYPRRFETINGETKSIGEWVKHSGLQIATVYKRLQAGWPLIQALGIVPHPRAKV
jgi:hypothetical protein